MQRCLAYAGMIALVVPAAAAAAPDSEVRSLSLPAQPLAATLQAIAARYGVELLFSQSIVGDRSAPPVASRLSARDALNLVLQGTGLVANQTAEGSFIVTVAPVAVSEQPAATPEILVIGRRTQDTDVRRTENDVRPYQVVTREDVATSHVATIEELAAKKLSANDVGAALSQQGTSAEDLPPVRTMPRRCSAGVQASVATGVRAGSAALCGLDRPRAAGRSEQRGRSDRLARRRDVRAGRDGAPALARIGLALVVRELR